MAIKWTENQQKAIDSRSGTLLLSAAAGSGKTAVLVERIITLLVNDKVRPEQLLVCTFTNAAASEMRAKLCKRIDEIIIEKPDDANLRKIRMTLDEADIGTMDSYFIKTLRENYNLCNVSPDFSIIDKALENILSDEALNETLDALTEIEVETPVSSKTNAYEILSDFFTKNAKEKEIKELISKVYNISVSMSDPFGYLDKTTANFCKSGEIFDSLWGKIVKDYALSALGAINDICQSGIEISNSYNEDNVTREADGYIEFFKSIAEKTQKILDISDSVTYDVMRRDILDIEIKRKPGKIKDDIEKILGSKFYTISSFFKDVNSSAGFHPLKAPIRLNELFLAESKEIRQENRELESVQKIIVGAVKMYSDILLEKKRKRNEYSFSDIMHFALNIVLDKNGNKTKRAREIADRYAEILIDEYQDTNEAQEAFFRAISCDGQNIFMVGDIKQSIYSFRNATPELFAEKYNAYPMNDGINANIDKKTESKIILERNFRSRQGVLENVNYVFKRLMSKESSGIDYNDDEALYYGGLFDGEQKQDEFTFCLADGGHNEPEYIADMIKKMVDDGTLVQIKKMRTPDDPEFVSEEDEKKRCFRRAVYSDFCILLRSANKVGKEYVDALAKKGIQSSFSSGGKLFDTLEGKMLSSLLIAISNPSDSIALTAVMISPLYGFTVDEVAKIKHDKKNMYRCVCEAADKNNRKCKSLLADLQRYRFMSSVQSIDEFVTNVVDESSLIPIVSALDDGDERVLNCHRICSMATKYGTNPNPSLSGFIRYLKKCMETGIEVEGSTGLSTNEQEVKILSVHKSKGLEFPFVILANCDRFFNREDVKGNYIIHKNAGVGFKRTVVDKMSRFETLGYYACKISRLNDSLSDELRLLYVAMTRAKERIICVSQKKGNIDEYFSGCEALLNMDGSITPFLLNNADSFCDLLCLSLLPNRFFGPNACMFDSYMGEHSRLSVQKASDFYALYEEKNEDEVSNEQSLEIVYDKNLLDAIRQRSFFKYKYEYPTTIRPKNTASSFEKKQDIDVINSNKKPSFCYSSEFSPAQKGTINHKFLQECDIYDVDVTSQIKRLVEKGVFTEDEGREICVDEMKKFLTGNLCDAIKNADYYYREKKFMTMLPLKYLSADINENIQGEEVLVIGKVDLLFVKDNIGTVVDYKTDRNKTEEEFIDNYAMQLKVYALAMESMLNIEIKTVGIYSLSLGKFIKIVFT